MHRRMLAQAKDPEKCHAYHIRFLEYEAPTTAGRGRRGRLAALRSPPQDPVELDFIWGYHYFNLSFFRAIERGRDGIFGFTGCLVAEIWRGAV